MVTLRITSEPMPLQFSTVGGDAIQNLRAALDLLAFQLVLLRVPAQRRIDLETPGTHTAFPIFSHESEFEARVRKPAQRDKKGPLLGLDVTSPEWAIVESFQPYKRRNDVETDELAILSSFSNRDKHQGLLAGVSFSYGFEIEEVAEIRKASSVEILFELPDALEHDTPLARVHFDPAVVRSDPSDPPGVHMKGDPPFVIALSDGDTALPVSALDRIRARVVTVIRAFEDFF